MRFFLKEILAVTVILGAIHLSRAQDATPAATPVAATPTVSQAVTPLSTPPAKKAKAAPQLITTSSGLQYQVLKEGQGDMKAKVGQTVWVLYTGWLTDGKKFDSSVDPKSPFRFILGVGQVIPGWDEGVEGMKVGEKRKLTIPSDLGYGDKGMPPVIPPKATLVFDVELVRVE